MRFVGRSGVGAQQLRTPYMPPLCRGPGGKSRRVKASLAASRPRSKPSFSESAPRVRFYLLDSPLLPRYRCRRIEKAVALSVGSTRTRAAYDVFDVAAADADIAQLMIRELRQFAHRVSMPAPSVVLLRDHFEENHLHSFSDAPRRLLGRKPIVAGAQGGRTTQSAKFSTRAFFSSASSPVLQNSLNELSRKLDCTLVSPR